MGTAWARHGHGMGTVRARHVMCESALKESGKFDMNQGHLGDHYFYFNPYPANVENMVSS